MIPSGNRTATSNPNGGPGPRPWRKCTAASGNKQYHVEIAPGDLGEYVIVAGDPGRISKIAAHFESPQEVTANRGFVAYSGTLNGVRVGAVAHGIGGPSMAIVAEELARSGVHTIIRAGTCGGLQDDVKPGDLVIATAAVRHEGLSQAYVPLEIPLLASSQVVEALSAACSERDPKITFHLGLVESKDSFYGEVHPDSMPLRDRLLLRWNVMREVGVLATEMECAALFAVALVRRLRAGAVLKVLSAVGAHPGSPEEAHQLPRNMPLDDLIEAAVGALARLIEQVPGKETVARRRRR
ncbi:MAG TPA: nucleoside phosphorylase [Clostridia bacterium]|nr:nucleoside phosphorylase [Clostridia bacterium]